MGRLRRLLGICRATDKGKQVAKKGLMVLVIAALVAGGAFAQVQMSAGGGLVFNGGRLGGVSSDKDFMGENHIGFGGFLFFDATYAELSLGFTGGPTNAVVVFDGDKETEKSGSMTGLDIGLLGRYPIEVGSLTVAPLLGLAYNLVIGMKDADGEKIESDGDFKVSDSSNLRLQLGVGTDLSINDNLYVRIQGLGHYRLPSKSYTDSAKFMKDLGDDKAKAAGGLGGTFTLALGYKF